MTTATKIKPFTREEQQRQNVELAQRINRETRANPDSPYAGKYVVVAHGGVVAVVDSLDETTKSLETLGIDPAESVYIEASVDYDTPIWINPYRRSV